MKYLKTLLSSFGEIANFIDNTSGKVEKKAHDREESSFDIKDDQNLITYLTKQFIINDLAADESKVNADVFNKHRQKIVDCLKRYEAASLTQLEIKQKLQAETMLKALQKGLELPDQSDDGLTIDHVSYINGLKKITLSYCQQYVGNMSEFITNVPEQLCDGKNASTAWQSIRQDASKKRWQNFNQACRDNYLVCFNEEILFDTTLWGSAKNGFMLGSDAVTCLGGEPEKFQILWSDVKSLSYHKGYLYINDYKTGFVANDKACELLEQLEEQFNKIKRSEGNKLLDYLGYDRSSQIAIKSCFEEDIEQFIL